MSKRQIIYGDLTGGINNVETKEQLNSTPRKTESPDMVNVEYFGLGGIQTMEGNTQIGDKQSTPIVGGCEYTKGNKRYMMIATQDGYVKIYNDITNTYDEVFKFEHYSDKVSFCNVNDGIVVSNGIDDLLFYEHGRNTELQGVVSLDKDNNYILKGIQTQFGTDVKVGDYIRINNVNGKYKVESINSDKLLTVNKPLEVKKGVEYYGFVGDEVTRTLSYPDNLSVINYDNTIDENYDELKIEYNYKYNNINGVDRKNGNAWFSGSLYNSSNEKLEIYGLEKEAGGYAIKNGNLYHIENNSLVELSNSGEWTDIFSVGDNDYFPYTNIGTYGFNNGKLYCIEKDKSIRKVDDYKYIIKPNIFCKNAGGFLLVRSDGTLWSFTPLYSNSTGTVDNKIQVGTAKTWKNSIISSTYDFFTDDGENYLKRGCLISTGSKIYYFYTLTNYDGNISVHISEINKFYNIISNNTSIKSSNIFASCSNIYCGMCLIDSYLYPITSVGINNQDNIKIDISEFEYFSVCESKFGCVVYGKNKTKANQMICYIIHFNMYRTIGSDTLPFFYKEKFTFEFDNNYGEIEHLYMYMQSYKSNYIDFKTYILTKRNIVISETMRLTLRTSAPFGFIGFVVTNKVDIYTPLYGCFEKTITNSGVQIGNTSLIKYNNETSFTLDNLQVNGTPLIGDTITTEYIVNNKDITKYTTDLVSASSVYSEANKNSLVNNAEQISNYSDNNNINLSYTIPTSDNTYYQFIGTYNSNDNIINLNEELPTTELQYYLTDISELNAYLINTDPDVASGENVHTPIRGTAIQYYNGRLWVGTDNGLFYSAVGLPNNWDIYSDAGVLYSIYNDSSKISALGLFSEYLTVHKQFSTYVLTCTGSSDTIELKPFSNITCESQQGWIVSNTKYFVFSKDFLDIYPLIQHTVWSDKFLGVPISQNIRNLFKKVRIGDTDKIFCVGRPKERQMMFYLPIDGYVGSNIAVVYDFQTNSWLLRQVPQNVTSAWQYDNKIYIGTESGKVLEEFKGKTFDGEPINSYYKSPWFDWTGDYTQSFAEFIVEIDNTEDNNFYLDTQKDGLSRTEVRTIDSNKLYGESMLWAYDNDEENNDKMNWDNNNWLRATFETIRMLLPNNVFEDFQLRFFTDKIGQLFKIFKYGFRRIETEEAPW